MITSLKISRMRVVLDYKGSHLAFPSRKGHFLAAQRPSFRTNDVDIQQARDYPTSYVEGGSASSNDSTAS